MTLKTVDLKWFENQLEDGGFKAKDLGLNIFVSQKILL